MIGAEIVAGRELPRLAKMRREPQPIEFFAIPELRLRAVTPSACRTGSGRLPL